MTDLERLTAEATKQAAIAVGREAAKRAVDGILSDDEEPPKNDESPKASKTKRWKIALVVVLGLCLVVGLIGLLLHYWMWFLAAGVLGLVGLVGWSRLRKRLAARKPPKPVAEPAAPAVERVRVRAPPPAAAAEDARAVREQERAAREQQRAVSEEEIDEELEAMKARLKG